MKKLLLHFLIFFINTFNIYAQQPVVNDYSGDYVLSGEVKDNPAKESNDVQKTLKIVGDVMYIRIKDIYQGEYELNWRTPQGMEFPAPIEQAIIFISDLGRMKGEFYCNSNYEIVNDNEKKSGLRVGFIGALSTYEMPEDYDSDIWKTYGYKCKIDGKFSNKKLQLHYKLLSRDGSIVFEGWREGKRRKSF